VTYFWGVKANTVWTWRKALGVGQYNDGTTALKIEVTSRHPLPLPGAAVGEKAQLNQFLIEALRVRRWQGISHFLDK
jgi:hypothetical protein